MPLRFFSIRASSSSGCRIAETRIANSARTATHQHDRFVARPLKPAQHHDRDKVSDVQAVGGQIETVVGCDRSGAEPPIECAQIGALVDESALGKRAEKIGPGLKGLVAWGHHVRSPLRPKRPETCCYRHVADLAASAVSGK